MIEVADLRFRWPGAAHDCVVIDDFKVAAGSSLFLHGPSGGGKSTLLGLLAGVLLPKQGGVSLLGTPWAALSGSRRDAFRVAHVGYIFQQFNLLPYLSVLDNVLLPCRFSDSRRERAVTGAVARPPPRLTNCSPRWVSTGRCGRHRQPSCRSGSSSALRRQGP